MAMAMAGVEKSNRSLATDQWRLISTQRQPKRDHIIRCGRETPVIFPGKRVHDK